MVGKQNFGSHKDQVELTTVGCFFLQDGYYILEYVEEQEPPEAPVQVCVRVRQELDEVQMERRGANRSCLVFKQGVRSQCRYGTEYGDLEMGLFGQKINLCLNQGEGELDFRYVIDMNGQVASHNQVKITFREN